jgi:hypothetical protein
MAVVWILLASSGLFFARYTRDNWPNVKLLETKVWFQVGYTFAAVMQCMAVRNALSLVTICCSLYM